jgi:hypothetical protein
MNKVKAVLIKFGSWLKERARRLVVFLKKSPEMIPITALVVSFLVYSLNLTDISDTTAKIYGPFMGLCSFVTMLFMILSFVCMLSAFPKRKKPNALMISLMMAMYAVVIAADVLYYIRIENALTRAESPIKLTESTMYIWSAQNVIVVHIITVVITMALVLLEPVIAKLLRKINTTVELEDSATMEEIELSEDE